MAKSSSHDSSALNSTRTTNEEEAKIFNSAIDELIAGKVWELILRDEGTTAGLFQATYEAIENLKQIIIRHLQKNNRITAAFPHSFSRLEQVIKLDLSGNNLTSTIPDFIFDLTTLQELNLENNNFTGWIPARIGHLYQLEVINLKGNSLSGYLPATLLKCKLLKQVCLSGRNNMFCVVENTDYQLNPSGRNNICKLTEKVISSWSINYNNITSQSRMQSEELAQNLFLENFEYLDDYSSRYQVELKSYLSPNFRQGDTFLSRACHANNEAVTKYISFKLSQGVEPIITHQRSKLPFTNQFQSFSVAAFHRAIELNQTTIFHILLKTYPDLVNKPLTFSGNLPIQTAYNCGTTSHEIITKLLDSPNFPMTEDRIDKLLPNPNSLDTNLDKYKRDFRFIALCFSHTSNHTLKSINIHLLGDGFSGKSTIRNTFKEKLPRQTPVTSVLYSMSAKFGLRRPEKAKSVKRDERTIGCEIETVSNHRLGASWRFFDYGGQKRFHGNHIHFLGLSDSIYIIVLSLCNFNLAEIMPHELFDGFYIEQRYEYWLHYLNSIPQEQNVEGTMKVITIINGKSIARDLWPRIPSEPIRFGNSFQDYLENKVFKSVSAAQTKFTESPDLKGKIEFVGDPKFVCINNNEKDDVQNFVVNVVTKTTLNRQSVHVPKCVTCFKTLVANDFSMNDSTVSIPFVDQLEFTQHLTSVLNLNDSNYASGTIEAPSTNAANVGPSFEWETQMSVTEFQPIMLKSDLIEVISEKLPAQLKWIGESPGKDAMVYVCEKLIERLNNLREIIVIVDASKSTDNHWILINLEMLSKNILGRLVEESYHEKSRQPSTLLTSNDIRNFLMKDPTLTNILNLKDSVIFNLLQNIGVCIPINLISASKTSQLESTKSDGQPEKHQTIFFLPTIQRKQQGSEKSITPFDFDDSDSGCQVIQRRYKLKGCGTQIFPPGYFERLCSKVCNLELELQSSTASDPRAEAGPMTLKLFDDALLIERVIDGFKVQTITWFDALEFTVRVSSKSVGRLVDIATESSGPAAIRMASIHNFIKGIEKPILIMLGCNLEVDKSRNKVFEDDGKDHLLYFAEKNLTSENPDSVAEAIKICFGKLSKTFYERQKQLENQKRNEENQLRQAKVFEEKLDMMNQNLNEISSKVLLAVFEATEVTFPCCFVILDQRLTLSDNSESSDMLNDVVQSRASNWSALCRSFRESYASLGPDALVDSIVGSCYNDTDTAYFYVVDEYTMKPILVGDTNKDYPIKIERPAEFVSQCLPLIRATLKAAMVLNGLAGVAQCLGYPVPNLSKLIEAATQVINELDQSSTVANFSAVDTAFKSMQHQPMNLRGYKLDQLNRFYEDRCPNIIDICKLYRVHDSSGKACWTVEENAQRLRGGENLLCQRDLGFGVTTDEVDDSDVAGDAKINSSPTKLEEIQAAKSGNNERANEFNLGLELHREGGILEVWRPTHATVSMISTYVWKPRVVKIIGHTAFLLKGLEQQGYFEIRSYRAEIGETFVLILSGARLERGTKCLKIKVENLEELSTLQRIIYLCLPERYQPKSAVSVP